MRDDDSSSIVAVVATTSKIYSIGYGPLKLRVLSIVVVQIGRKTTLLLLFSFP